MEWLEITGNSLAFIGSVVVSSDLVQSKRYVEAQNRTYFDKNPFTLRSNKTNVIGFLLIVTGFGTSLSASLSGAAHLDTSQTLCVLTGLIAICVLLIIYLYRMNERMYERLEAQRRLTIFNSAVSNIKRKFQSIIGQHNEQSLFPVYKEGDIAALTKHYEDLTDSQKNEYLCEVYRKLAQAKTAREIVKIANKYTREISSRN